MSFLGIDVGTSGAKAVAIGRDGRPIAQARRAYGLKSAQAGWVELDPREVWNSVRDAIREAAALAAEDPVEMICTSSLGESFVLMDSNGQPLCASPIYFDLRGEAQTERLRAYAPPERWMRMVGLKPHRQQSLPKLMWLVEHRPELFERATKLHFFADYILACLGAPHVTDASLGFTSMMLDFRSQNWRREPVALSGIPEDILPRVLPAGTDLGRVDARVAEELGLSRNVRLVLGGHDQMMCALGCGVTDSSLAANSMGTTDAITPLVRGTARADALFDRELRLAPFSAIEDMYASSVFNLNGGALLNWFHKTLGGGEAQFARMEAEMPEDSGELIVLPNFGGRQDAANDQSMRGAFLGMDYDTTLPMLYRALLEGQAFELKMWLENFEAAMGAIECLNATGGASQSDKNLQLRADIFGKPIGRLRFQEAGTLGNAMVCCVAAGMFPNLADAAGHFVKINRVFEPRPESVSRYIERFERYRKYYKSLG